jgi:hypothetical protein
VAAVDRKRRDEGRRRQRRSRPSAAYRARSHDGSEDSDVAASIKTMLRRAELAVVSEPGAPADTEVVVVSTDTRRAWLERRTANAPPNVVFVFATGVAEPEQLPGLAPHQWVDYRRRSHETLEFLTLFFYRPDIPDLTLGVNLEPERVDRAVTPVSVFVIYWTFMFIAGPAIGAGLATLFIEAPVYFSENGALVLATGVLLAATAWSLARRRLSRWQLVAVFGLAIAAEIVIGGTPTISVIDPLEAQQDVRWGAPLLLGVALFYSGLDGHVWQWLPRARSLRFRRRGRLPEPRHSKVGVAYLTLSAALWAALIHSWSSPAFAG